MIAFLLLLQTAVASANLPVPTFVVVRDGASAVSIPVTVDGGEPSVRADALMRAMRGTLITSTNLHYTLSLPHMRLDLIDGIPFAKLDTLTIPLNRAPQVRGGVLYLPFQFVSELIPRYGGGYTYDVGQAELRSSTFLANRPPPPAATTPTPTGAPSNRASSADTPTRRANPPRAPSKPA